MSCNTDMTVSPAASLSFALASNTAFHLPKSATVWWMTTPVNKAPPAGIRPADSGSAAAGSGAFGSLLQAKRNSARVEPKKNLKKLCR